LGQSSLFYRSLSDEENNDIDCELMIFWTRKIVEIEIIFLCNERGERRGQREAERKA
jgi:hypothetical protein